MKAIIKSTLVLLLLIASYRSFSQADDPMKKFRDLRGNWVSIVKLTLGDLELNVDYEMDITITAGNSGVLVEDKAVIPELGTLRGINLVGFDPHEGKYHWFSVDNFGVTHDHIGQFLDDTHFYIEHNSVRDGKAFQEKFWIDWLGKDRLKLKLVATTDGIVEQIAEGIFKRKNRSN